MHQQTLGKKIEYRRLILFTNFDHQFSDDNLEDIVGGFNTGNPVQLNVISPRFEDHISSSENDDAGNNDDDSNSFGEGPSNRRQGNNSRQTLSEKPKTPQQRAGERLISQILNQGVDGCVYSYDQAVVALAGFEKKAVRSVAWKCDLTIGNDLAIPCTAYVKTKASTLKKTWKKVYAKTEKAEDIEQQKYYVLQSDQNEEVDESTLGKGYKYGKDVIPFSKIDEEQMKYKAEAKCLSILGFTEQKHILIQDLMDDQAHYVFPQNDDPAAQAALNALIAALHSMNMVAVARYVYRKGLSPKLVALLPKVKGNKRCLVMVSLPFAEDVRTLEFPSLDSHKSAIPDENQLAAVDNLIDSMNLCQGDTELYSPKEILNPYYQCVYHNLSHRALHPNEEMPPLDERITNILTPSEQIIERSRSAANEVARRFTLQKQEQKKKKLKGKDMWEDVDLNKPKKDYDSGAGGDASSDVISNLFREPGVTAVGSVTPVQDFIALLKTKEENGNLIFEQMQERILEFVFDSFGLGADKVIPCIRIMREQAIAKERSELFNSFMMKLKNILLEEDLSYRRKHWEAMVNANLSLIIGPGVAEKDCEDFLAAKSESKGEVEMEDDKVDAMDLLDEL